MNYSRKRQSFLVNQGYAYKIVNKIPAMEQETGLDLSTPAEQASLLQQVLQASDKDLEEEETLDDEGNPSAKVCTRFKRYSLFANFQVNRKEASISSFSGGSNANYSQKPKKAGDAEKHPLFKLLRR